MQSPALQPGQPAAGGALPPPVLFVTNGCATTLFGVLPLVGLGAELSLDALGEFHTLFPTGQHKLVVAAAVLANFVLHLRVGVLARAPRLHAALLGLATAMALLYAVVAAPALPLILAAFFFAGLGVLAAAPFWASFGLVLLWRRFLARPDVRGVDRWLILAVAALAPLAFCLTAQPSRPDDATALAHLVEARERGDQARIDELAAACRAAPLAPQLLACEHGIGASPLRWSGHAAEHYWFLEDRERTSRQWIDPVLLRAAFHLAHGFDWRDEAAADGRGLRWSASRCSVEVEPDAALAVVDWQIEVHSDLARSQEAEFAIELAPGGVATGLSLWIDGEERPAAFASTGRVSKAYEAVTATLRDPALLTETGPGRLRLRLFPVAKNLPPMRARLRFAVPLELGETGNRLHLPIVRGVNLAPAAAAHRVEVRLGEERSTGDRSPSMLREPVPIPLGRPMAGCTDARGALLQRLAPLPPASPAGTAVVVLEASRSVGSVLPKLSAALDAFAADAECAVFVAIGERHERRAGRAGDPALRAWLDATACNGGVDPRPALRAALDLAQGGRVYWLHGDCPRVASPWGPARRRDAELLAVALTDGVHCVRDDPAFAASICDATVGATAQDRIAALGEFVRRGAPADALSVGDARLRTFERVAALPASAAAATDHLARLWAAGEARRLAGADEPAAARALAASYRLVTAGVGAVVLERQEQYAEHGLDPGAPLGFEPPGAAGGAPVPEPGTLLLVATGLLAVAFATRRRRSTRAA